MEFSDEPRYENKKCYIWRKKIRLSKDKDKEWHEQPILRGLGWQLMEFCLSLVSLYIIIKNLEEDIGFIFIMLVQDITKLKILFQKILMAWKTDQILPREM